VSGRLHRRRREAPYRSQLEWQRQLFRPAASIQNFEMRCTSSRRELKEIEFHLRV
jgi:hypothetical protein